MKTHLTMLAIVFAALPVSAAASGDPTPTQDPVPAAEPAEPANPANPADPADPADPARPGERALQGTHVARATFTTEVVGREPVDELDHLSGDLDRVFFFTEIRDLSGEVITHRWLHDGDTVAEVPIDIGGPRWRVYSIKTLPADPTGTWTVQVVDTLGDVLHESEIRGEPGGMRVSELNANRHQ